jgi:poly(3-hydroxybutyrate) depolymerase
MATAPQTDDIGARARAIYDLEDTTVFASRTDPRFSYCLYVPPRAVEPGARPALVVAVHGTGRTMVGYRDAFASFARWNNCVVLAPLFPVGVRGDGNRDGYKYIREGDIRYDRVLLAMVDEVAEKYALAFEKFALFGFSGGGHFAHRFLLLHPDKLWAASIGAPGSVTLLDAKRDWWVGVRNMREIFGSEPDLAALRRVPVHMVVGGADIETWEITHREGGKSWMPGANDAGRTRPERLDSLRRSFEEAGVTVKLEIVPGVAHDWARCVGRTMTFFADVLQQQRARG